MAIHHPLLFYLLFLWISIFLIGVVLSGAPHNNSSEKICSAKERNSLLQFKTKLFDPNGILSSWTEEDNCCRWKGISCDDSGVVVMVDLNSLRLSGEIDSSLLSLQNLQHLDLSGNNFSTSSFPSFIGSLKELSYPNHRWMFPLLFLPKNHNRIADFHRIALAREDDLDGSEFGLDDAGSDSGNSRELKPPFHQRLFQYHR